MKVLINTKEVHNPVKRFLVIVFLICMIALTVTFGFSVIFIGIALIIGIFIISIPLHYILKYSGRRGFYIKEDNTHKWTSKGAFKKLSRL